MSTKMFLLIILSITLIKPVLAVETQVIASTCLQEIASNCKDIDPEKLNDQDFLEQLAHDPNALRICPSLRCINNISIKKKLE